MELTFLGRGSAFNVLEGNTAACWSENRHLLLLDCGQTVFQALVRRRLMENVDRIDVCITHLHNDHAGSLGTLVEYCYYVLKIPMRIIVPHDEEYCRQLKEFLLLSGCPEFLLVFVFDDELDGYDAFSAFRYQPTSHSPLLRCFCFEFDTPEGGIFYSGDSNSPDAMLRFLQDHPRPERIFTEATHVDYPGSVHMYIGKLAAAVPEAVKDRVRLMHTSSEECTAVCKSYGFQHISVK